MIDPRHAEILAPVGSYESLAAAITAGADAIYFGVTQLNMRAKSANNMTIEDLKEVARRCHEAKIHAYLTVNTILYDHDMTVMKKIVDAAKTADIDAIIASDWAVIQYCSEVQMPVHFSTQMSISNYDAIKFAARFTNRVVLARELNLDQIKKISDQIKKENLMGVEGRLMEIECFAHGALCVAQSGRCYMSLQTYNSSANRGACKQNCRAKYKVTDVDTGKELIIDNEFVMSPNDICTIDIMDQMLDAGIMVFKIEGRGRPPEYVDTVIRAYKAALNDIAAGTYTKERIAQYFDQLKTVYNRGLSDGYYLGKEIGSWAGSEGSKATKEKVFVGTVTHYFPKPGIAEVSLHASALTAGEELKIMGSTTGVVTVAPAEIWVDEKAVPSADKGVTVTFAVPTVVRNNDKVYKMIDRAV